MTLLQLAVFQGRLDVVKYLASKKDADITVTTRCKENLLHLAARSRNIAVMKYLIEDMNMLAHINEVEDAYHTPAMVLAMEGPDRTAMYYNKKDERVKIYSSEDQKKSASILRYLVDKRNASIASVDLYKCNIAELAHRANNYVMYKYLTGEKGFANASQFDRDNVDFFIQCPYCCWSPPRY